MKLNIIKRLLTFILLTSCSLHVLTCFAADTAYVADGDTAICDSNGDYITHPVYVDDNYNPTFTIPAQNKAGLIINIPDMSTSYHITCATNYTTVPEGINVTVPNVYYSTRTTHVFPAGHADGWFSLDDFFDFKVEWSINGNFYTAPFSNISDNTPRTFPSSTASHPDMTVFSSTMISRVSLYLKKPIIKSYSMPRKALSAIIFFGPTPLPAKSFYGSDRKGLEESIAINIQVIQSCNINSGNNLDVDLGQAISTEFATKGQKPVGYIDKTVNINVGCTNISDGVKINMKMSGATDATLNDAWRTSNSSIALRIMNESGNIISPADGNLPLLFDYTAQTGVSTIKVSPINTTGKAVPPGDYNAQMTLETSLE